MLQVRMAPTPAEAALRPAQPILSSSAAAFIIKWAPYALVGLVYAATSYVRWKKVRCVFWSWVERVAAGSCRRSTWRSLHDGQRATR